MVDILELLLMQIHVLIGGRTGAGKSVLLNGLIYTAMISDPRRLRFILIDPKRVELYRYRSAPHCLRYASEPADMIAALQAAEIIMDTRYKTLQALNRTQTTEPPIYIFIDELADLLDVCGKSAEKTLKRLLQLGRAAGIHVVACTQHVSRRTLPAALQINFSAVVALPQRSAIESRQLIGCRGAEGLDIGTAYIITPDIHTPQRVHVPKIRPEDLEGVLHLWDDLHTVRDTAKPQTKRRGLLHMLFR